MVTMFAIVFLATLACASAAPQWHNSYNHLYPNNYVGGLDEYLNKQFSQIDQFWEKFEKDMTGLNQMMTDLAKRYPNQYEQTIEGNEYKIKIRLSGFDAKEITVTAKKGILTVQAVHEDTNGNFLHVTSLPDCVDTNGRWTYENGVILIVFPWKCKSQEPTVITAVNQVPVTPSTVTQDVSTPASITAAPVAQNPTDF